MDKNQKLEDFLLEINKLKSPIKETQKEIDRIKFEALKIGNITEEQIERLKILEQQLKSEQNKLDKFLDLNKENKEKLSKKLKKEFKEKELEQFGKNLEKIEQIEKDIQYNSLLLDRVEQSLIYNQAALEIIEKADLKTMNSAEYKKFMSQKKITKYQYQCYTK